MIEATKESLLQQLPRAALDEIVFWLDRQNRDVPLRARAAKDKLVTALSAKLTKDEIQALRDRLSPVSPHLNQRALAAVLGLLPKEEMLRAASLEDLRDVALRLELSGGVRKLWRSLTKQDLLVWLARTLTADEIAQYLGLQPATQDASSGSTWQSTLPMTPAPPVSSSLGRDESIAAPGNAVSSLASEVLGMTPLVASSSPGAALPGLADLAVMHSDLADLWAFVRGGGLLAALRGLISGPVENERELALLVRDALKERVATTLKIRTEPTVGDKRPDIVVAHATGSIVFELKNHGSEVKLLEDLRKLRGYLGREFADGSYFVCGVLIYRSPFEEPARVQRFCRGRADIAVVRVDTRTRSKSR